MMRNHSCLFLILGCLCLQPGILSGQIVPIGELPERPQFGTIPDSLFEDPAGVSAPVEILHRYTDIGFSERNRTPMATIEILVRMRIGTDDPLLIADASQISLPYYAYENMEVITEVEGWTHHTDGSRTAMDTDQMVDTGLSPLYRLLEFTLPAATEGDVLEFRYKMERRYLDELPDHYFTWRFPVRLNHLVLRNEPFLRYETVPENLTTEVGYQEARIDRSGLPLLFSIPRPEPHLVQHWVARDVPPVRELEYAGSIEDRRARLRFLVSEFGRPRQPLINSWEVVIARLRRGDGNPWHHIVALEELHRIGEQIAEEADTPGSQELVQEIFTYLNSRMVFNGEHRTVPETDPARVLEGDPSDQAAINLALTSLLRGAGLNASPLFVAGRERGRVNRSLPTIYQFNRLLVQVTTDEGELVMDGSYAYSRPGMIPPESWTRNALLLGPDSFHWVDPEPGYGLYDLDLELEAWMDANGDLEANFTAVTSGYPARQIRSELAEGRPAGEIVSGLFLDAYGDLILTEATIEEVEEGQFPIRIEASFRIPQYAVSFQEGLQFRPMIVGYLYSNPFEEEERRIPVTLDGPESISVRYTIHLPDQFRVQSQQEEQLLQGGDAQLREQYELDGRTLYYSFGLEIPRREYHPDQYPALRQLYERWVTVSHQEWFAGSSE
ncbi:MAG: hypothetical protein WDZ29_07630 [Balneolaceae bacterium]